MPKVEHFHDRDIKSYSVEKGQVTYFEKQRMRAGHSNRGLSLALSVSYGGSKTWYAVTYVASRPKWTRLGKYPELSLSAARDAAWSCFENPAKFAEQASVGTFAEIADQWYRAHVIPNRLRSQVEIARHIRYANEHLGRRKFTEIRRPEVAVLLDHLARTKSTIVADSVLSTVSRVMTWYEGRSEDYRSPIVKAMRRGGAVSRSRILEDDELRTLWEAADEAGRFGAFIKLCLLTAQRQGKVTTMRWSDIVDGVWTVPEETVEERRGRKGHDKGTGGRLKLPEIALDILAQVPRIDGNDFVFPGHGGKPFTMHVHGMEALREATGLPHFTIHDLRRTARSLMTPAGVDRDTAERVLGHAIGGAVEETYDRYKYERQKADALARLANLIESIVDPTDNVVPLRAG